MVREKYFLKKIIFFLISNNFQLKFHISNFTIFLDNNDLQKLLFFSHPVVLTLLRPHQHRSPRH